MNTTDLGTNSLYRAHLAYFLYTHDLKNADRRISHQLLDNATAVQARYGICDKQASAIIDQAHAAATAELVK